MTAPYRLPRSVWPQRYDVHLRATVGKPTFDGEVRIALAVKAATPILEIHARDIEVHEAVAEQDGRELRAKVQGDADREMLSLRFDEELRAGEAFLQIRYAGKVQANMEGLYLSKDGDEQCLSTQCEETDARAIFPCFDEPEFKARFAWKVTTEAENTVLANGPLIGVEASGAQKTWTFEATKPMSSYLVALVVGKLASGEERIVEGVPMRVWAMKGKEGLGAFGNDFAAKLLPWYNEYFGVSYPFAKYDQVAVPSFSAGAMENSGLVIFRQSLLLKDPKTTSWNQERLIARVIAHEFAHMWFGNLVTMAWWDDIWLNESFAEWMAHKATHVAAPEYRIWDDFQAGKREALSSDALASTHSIYTPVETPEQATELFDAITYNKGATLMRMIETFLGEDAFRAGLRTYMKEFAERNAKGADLWRHLEKSSSQPVTKVMESWILQPGYPVVSAKLEGSTLRLSQRRYHSSPGVRATTQTWSVPLIVRYKDAAGIHETRHLLSDREGALPLKLDGELKWLTLNASGIGFFRQQLDATLREKLQRGFAELEPAEQMDLVDDAWALVRSGDEPIATFLGVLEPALRAAGNQSVLALAVERAERIEEILVEAADPKALAGFRKWLAAALEPEARRLGWEPRAADSRDDAERRVHALHGLAGVAQDPAAIRAAVAIADREAMDARAVDPTIAGVAVRIAARFGDEARLDKHVELYDARRAARASPPEVQRYLTSLAEFRQPGLPEKVLQRVADGKLPLEAVGPLLRLMLKGQHSRVAAWGHMKANWKDIRGRLGDMWTGFLVDHTGHLPARLRPEMVAFYDANLQGVAQQAYARALEALDQRAELEARVRPELVKRFA